MPDDRDFDIVLFGATGFTGALTAEYLARNAPADLRWALAGRSPEKLANVRADLAAIDPALAELELLHADVSDPASLADVARRARVVITTVGPYLAYGEPLVAACAEAGTDYVDLTGESEFADRMYVAHHATAAAHRRPDRARLRLRLDPARPGRAVHRPAPADRPAGHGARRGPRRRAWSPAARSTRPSPGCPGSGRPGRRPPPARRSSSAPRDGRRARSPASRTGTRCWATGCSRCRRSTRSSWRAAAPRSRRTGRSSATPTTPAPRRCASPRRARPP